MNISELNEMQQEAVRHTDGPLLIIAGAGSGKTRVLTYRIAYLVEECGVAPYNILAITFTNKAAGEMKERVADITPDGYQVWVSTFHSMCVRILRRFAESLGFTRDFAIYDTDDCKSVMKELFKKNNVNTQYFKERNVLAAISSAKDELKTPEDMRREAESDFRLKTIADLYSQYQDTLRSNNAMDFDDLIFKTVTLFKTDKMALETYADRFHYIMVDEYQDTNTSQFQLVKLLAEKWNNICVVGDDDQSIYKFRGANIENILNFEKAFPGAKVVKLEQNYRSTGMILDAANSVIKNNDRRKGKSLWTGNEEGEKVSLLLFDNAYQEGEGIAANITGLMREGYSCSDFAILYRTNAQSRIIEEKLLHANVPYRIYGGVNFYQRREIKDILAYLKVLVNPADGQSLKRIINVPRRGIGQTSIDRVQAFADREGISFYKALRYGKDIPDIGTAYKKTDAFLELMESFKEAAAAESIEDLVQLILDETNYMDFISTGLSTDEIADKQDNIDELFSKITDFESGYREEDNNDDSLAALKAFLEEVSLVADTESGDGEGARVSLMTLHSAKGLEFPVVFMAGMEDGLFPSYMAISIMDNDKSELEEERRLCYVGITRAEKKLFMTFARERMVRGERHTSRVSRFIDEISPVLIERKNHSYVGDDFGFEGSADTSSDTELKELVFNEPKQGTTPRGRGEFVPKNKAKFDFLSMGGLKKTPSVKPAGNAPGFGKDFTKEFGDSSKRYASDTSENMQTETAGLEKEHSGNSGIQKKQAEGLETGSYVKPASSKFTVGDRVSNERFGDGTITGIEDKGRDNLLTVEFDEVGVKKMFEGFINLRKI